MSLDARLSTLWIRLQKRFAASQAILKEIPRINESIQPITNADDLLRKPRIMEIGAVFGAATTGHVEFLIPWLPNKRYWLLGVEYKVTGGASTIQAVILQDVASGSKIPLVYAAAGAYIHAMFGQPLPMEYGWKLYGDIATNAIGAAHTMTAYVVEEDAY